MQVLREKTKYGRLTERTPTNCPFNLRSDRPTTPDTYKEDYNYCILLIDPQTQKPVDIRIVKTTATLENFIKDKHGRHGLDILFHPNPIKLTADFWERYRKAKNGAERLALFTQFNVLTDKNMLFIDTITIDIDSKFKKAIHALEELIELLDIDREILEIKKTKSKNLRFSFSIEPIRPNEKNKNGNTNLENAKEFVSIINEFFKQRDLKADDSFKRINHPVWITKPEELKQEATKEIDFYTLYRKAKKLNKELQKAKAEESNREEKPKRRLMYLPAFMANRFREIELKTALEKAVETLARTHKQGTYIHFLQPVAGWCKYLGFSYSEFYDLVYPYVRKKEDIKKAWRYARPLEFKNKNPRKAKYDLVEYADRAIEYLKKNGATERQILLKEVFDNRKWLEQIVMQELKEQGVIKEYFEKQEGAGRPKKVYEIIENKGQEKDKQEDIDYTFSETHTFENHNEMGISQINNSLFRESILVGVGKSVSLTGRIEKIFGFFDKKIYIPPPGLAPFENSPTLTPIFDFYTRDHEPSRELTREPTHPPSIEDEELEKLVILGNREEEKKDLGYDIDDYEIPLLTGVWSMTEKKKQKQNQKQNKPFKVDNYMTSLDGQEVEIHIAYGNTVLQMQGRLKAKARYDLILEFVDDNGRLQKVVVNKAYVVMAKPLG